MVNRQQLVPCQKSHFISKLWCFQRTTSGWNLDVSSVVIWMLICFYCTLFVRSVCCLGCGVCPAVSFFTVAEWSFTPFFFPSAHDTKSCGIPTRQEWPFDAPHVKCLLCLNSLQMHKSGVLRKAIDYIKYLQQANHKLRQENMVLKLANQKNSKLWRLCSSGEGTQHKCWDASCSFLSLTEVVSIMTGVWCPIWVMLAGCRIKKHVHNALWFLQSCWRALT